MQSILIMRFILVMLSLTLRPLAATSSGCFVTWRITY